MSDLNKLIKKIRKFNKDRDWDQFHSYKDLAISLSIEAAEVLEHFQWKSPEEIEKRIKTHNAEVVDELADVLIYLVQMSDKLGVDMVTASLKKLRKQSKKYPVKKLKGKHNNKYTEL